MDEVTTQEAPAPELPMATELPAVSAKPLFNDYYCKFESEEAANAALVAAGALVQTDAVIDENEQVIQPAGFTPAAGVSIDVIGVIHKPTGNMIPTVEFGEQPEMAAIPGWHVNVRSSTEIEALKTYDIAPATPVRIWA